MTSSPKRPFFRFHLLTLVLMALSAGGSLFVNSLGRSTGFNEDELEWGFPSVYYGSNPSISNCAHIYPFGGIVDGMTLLIVLAIVGHVSETIIRRREGSRQ